MRTPEQGTSINGEAMRAIVIQAAPVLVRADTAARLLEISPRSLDRLVVHGVLPPPVRLGRIRRWVYQDLCKWAAAGCPGVDADG